MKGLLFETDYLQPKKQISTLKAVAEILGGKNYETKKYNCKNMGINNIFHINNNRQRIKGKIRFTPAGNGETESINIRNGISNK